MVAAIFMATAAMGCAYGEMAGNGIPTCGQGGAKCPQSPKTASKATYHCQIDMGNGNVLYSGAYHADLTVCLPADLNTHIADVNQLATINSETLLAYDQAIFNYGNTAVLPQTVALMGFDGDGKKCSDLLAALARPTTFCQEALPAVDGTFCDDAANFTPIDCCPQGGSCPPYNSCHCVTPDTLVGCPAGGINPNGCPCNTFPYPDPDECNISTGTVIYPQPGEDPPGTSGILEHSLAQLNSISINPTNSYIKTHVHFTDGLGVGHDDTETSVLHGLASLYGIPRSDHTASLLLDMYLQGTDATLTFSGVDVFLTISIKITNIAINGGMGSTYVNLDSSGLGSIPKGALSLVLESLVDGQKVIVPETNDDPIAINVNFSQRTFSIPPFTIHPFTNVDTEVAIAGDITNQPPVADAGPSQTLECTSVSGAEATLHGTVSDPDNDLDAPWLLQGPPVPAGDINFKGQVVAMGFNVPTATILAPFSPPALTTGYTLVAEDHSLQLAQSQTTVTVVDTRPPSLTLFPPEPSCLWAPNHKLVLYQLGNTLPFTATDTCDPKPAVEIMTVTSNQPDTGGGQGDFAPDAIVGKTALCLRSERQGTVMWDREYDITVAATDSSGNRATQVVSVIVPHDQAGAGKCPLVSSSRYVDETDPRCIQ